MNWADWLLLIVNFMIVVLVVLEIKARERAFTAIKVIHNENMDRLNKFIDHVENNQNYFNGELNAIRSRSDDTFTEENHRGTPL
jgi:hypothetical protein